MSEDLNINVESIEFMTLLASFATSGMIGLGKIPNPVTNKIEKNLEQAKYSIDILLMLKEKTKGNLAPEEEHALTNAIADLQINYIQEQGQEQCSCKGCGHDC